MDLYEDEVSTVADNAVMAHQGVLEAATVAKGFGPNNLIGADILEAGCGSGKLGINLSKQGGNVHLLDVDSDMLRKAKYISEVLSDMYGDMEGYALLVNFIIGSILDLPYPNNSFDLVFNEGVNEHFFGDERWRAFEEMVRVTRNMVICIVPNAECGFQAKRSAETKHNYKGMPEREEPFTDEELRSYLRGVGLSDVKVLKLIDAEGRPVRLAGKGKKT